MHRCRPFIWRFQSPHHRQAVLFYYFNINCASSGRWLIIFPAIRHREAGWRESGLWPVVREEWQPRGRRAPAPAPRPGLRGWAQRGTGKGRPAGEALHTALLHTCARALCPPCGVSVEPSTAQALSKRWWTEQIGGGGVCPESPALTVDATAGAGTDRSARMRGSAQSRAALAGPPATSAG